jgi:preprotein translocase subunit SecD
LPSEAAEAKNATTTTTTTPGATTTTEAPQPTEEAARKAIASCDEATIATLKVIPTTSRAEDVRDACVVLPDKPGGKNATRYLLGKAALTGKGTVDTAKAEFVPNQGWTVKMDLTDSGSSKWDALAQQQFQKQVAIVLDGLVQSAPTIQPNNATFESFGGTAVISGNFTQDEADNLAKLIRFGALPVTLKQVNVENVSPTLGNDQLHAGILAGIIGLALVAVYMLVFYRLLGLVVIAGILLSGMALYTLVAWFLPDVLNITIVLSLAGVTGIIVSVGVTVDSYIVYYERMKDEVRAGASVRSCVDRSFTRSFRTIVAADLVSLIGAVVLYVLAIGSVRGFALFLAISTILDLFVAYFFMHPVVSLMARRASLVRMKGVGIASGLDAAGVQA